MEVHRCRFVPYPPSTINALAFSHPSARGYDSQVPESLKLAVGRANGDIEIWNPLRGAWVHETTLRGGKDRSIEGLVWIQDPEEEDAEGEVVSGRLRLFSIGYSTYVTEWDLAQGRPLRISGGNYGEVWCVTAAPRPQRQNQVSNWDEERQVQDLAVGCADGAIVLLSTADADLRYKRLLARPSVKKARVLSIAFQHRSVVLAGCADGTIRILNTQTGQLIRNMSLGAGPVGGPKEILVWSLKVFPNGDIVSGDSTGEVCFWDGKTYSLNQRLKSHKADILDLEMSADGGTLFSGGMDRRTTVYRRAVGGKRNSPGRWAVISHRRFHSHDIKVMAAFDSKDMSVVVSGGLDTNLVVVPLREFGKENHWTIASLPQYPPVQSAPAKRLLMAWWNREVRIWRFEGLIRDSEEVDESFSGAERRTPRLVARIAIKGDENITSASLSTTGSLLAVSTSSEVKLFRLGLPKADGEVIKVRKLEIPPRLSNIGGRLVQFSPDTRWLCIITPDSHIRLARVMEQLKPPGDATLMPKAIRLKRLRRSTTGPNATAEAGLGPYERTITRVSFSADSMNLAVSDLSGFIDTWFISRHAKVKRSTDGLDDTDESSSSSSEDESSDGREKDDNATTRLEHWIRNPSASLIPHLGSAILILSFCPIDGPKARQLPNGTSKPPVQDWNWGGTRNDGSVAVGQLFVMTARHQVYEFDMSSGRLSLWSKRNPTSCLPSRFRKWKDRAMGCVWDVSDRGDRIWIYGSNWLCMLDLSQDLPEESRGSQLTANNTPLGKKRKWSETEDDPMPHASGAGDKVPDSKLMTGVGSMMGKFTGPHEDNKEFIPLDPSHKHHDNSGSEVGAAGDLRLALSRRALAEGSTQQNGSIRPSYDTYRPVNKGLRPPNAPSQRRGHGFWATTKYRPIMAVVPIARPDDDAGRPDWQGPAQRRNEDLTVALIERPLWDVDLPPRFYEDHEYGDK